MSSRNDQILLIILVKYSINRAFLHISVCMHDDVHIDSINDVPYTALNTPIFISRHPMSVLQYECRHLTLLADCMRSTGSAAARHNACSDPH